MEKVLVGMVLLAIISSFLGGAVTYSQELL